MAELFIFVEKVWILNHIASSNLPRQTILVSGRPAACGVPILLGIRPPSRLFRSHVSR